MINNSILGKLTISILKKILNPKKDHFQKAIKNIKNKNKKKKLPSQNKHKNKKK
jgi:hypothetical protein